MLLPRTCFLFFNRSYHSFIFSSHRLIMFRTFQLLAPKIYRIIAQCHYFRSYKNISEWELPHGALKPYERGIHSPVYERTCTPSFLKTICKNMGPFFVRRRGGGFIFGGRKRRGIHLLGPIKETNSKILYTFYFFIRINFI